MTILGIILGFVISVLISALIIYLAAKLFKEKEGFGTAVLAAITGAVIFSLASYVISTGWIAALVGALAWLFALKCLYSMGLLKSIAVAVVIWIFATILSLVIPTIILL